MVEFYLASSLEKVFADAAPAPLRENMLYSWPGESAAVQWVCHSPDGAPGMPARHYDLKITGAPGPVSLFQVDQMPVQLPCYEDSDEDYLRKTPGLYPDLLSPLAKNEILPLPRQYQSVWVKFHIPRNAAPGKYEIALTAVPRKRECTASGEWILNEEASEKQCTLTIHVGKNVLPPQKLIHTEWLHTDCLAEYYHLEVFSEAYWRVTENFIRAATENGINMILTPVFTPPLDTPVGGERMTVQLMDVIRDQGKYSFHWSKLERWLEICRRADIQYIEIPHLFTQWGAAATPKIIAWESGEEKRIFGWDVPADSSEYKRFLDAFLPALRSALKAGGYDDEHVFYHISDEPDERNKDAYLQAKGQTGHCLDSCRVLDALSSFSFYQLGLVDPPVCAADHIQPFLEAKAPHVWVYYCCAQGDRSPNRFLAMPSRRNRVMGVLMYLYGIEGFLQWGFNFYHSRFSLYAIDPFRTADADRSFPAGDPFLVYPGGGGKPLPSIRGEVQQEALTDLRLLQALEENIGRKRVEALIYEGESIYPFTFFDYPREDEYFLSLRERAAKALDAEG